MTTRRLTRTPVTKEIERYGGYTRQARGLVFRETPPNEVENTFEYKVANQEKEATVDTTVMHDIFYRVPSERIIMPPVEQPQTVEENEYQHIPATRSKEELAERLISTNKPQSRFNYEVEDSHYQPQRVEAIMPKIAKEYAEDGELFHTYEFRKSLVRSQENIEGTDGKTQRQSAGGIKSFFKSRRMMAVYAAIILVVVIAIVASGLAISQTRTPSTDTFFAPPLVLSGYTNYIPANYKSIAI